VHLEVFSVVMDIPHFSGIGVDAALPVLEDGLVLPAGLPQLITNFEILVGDVVPFVVG